MLVTLFPDPGLVMWVSQPQEKFSSCIGSVHLSVDMLFLHKMFSEL